MNAKEQREHCPVKIGQTYQGGEVIFVLGDKDGWDIETKREQTGTTTGYIKMPIHRTVWHRVTK